MSYGRDHNVVPIGEARAYREAREFSLSAVDPSSFSDRWMLFTHAARFWVHALEADEVALLFVIMDALYGWQNAADKLTLRRLSSGCGDKSRGTGRSTKATRATLHKLVARGLVRVSAAIGAESDIAGQKISINTTWMPEEARPMTLSVPKRLKKAAAQDDDGFVTPPVHGRPYNRDR